MAEAAGVLIVRGGSVLLSPRGPHLRWIGGRVEPGDADAARREAREEVGCDVELLHAPVTYGPGPGDAAPLAPTAPLLRTPRAVAYRASALGEPRALDVPALVWVPLDDLPRVRARPGSVVDLLRGVVAAFGPGVLGEGGARD